jgi:hypothetical protein
MDRAERAVYDEHYCGCCRALRTTYGFAAAFFINYEITFLSLVISAMRSRDEAPGAEDFRCSAFPLRKKKAMVFREPIDSYIASITVKLVESKLRDDVDDEGGFISKAALKLISGMAGKATVNLEASGFPVSLFTEVGAMQRRVERDPGSSLQHLAEPSASLVAEIFRSAASLSGISLESESIFHFGYCLGCAIYIQDAIIDYRRDLRKKRFNALAHARDRGEEREFFNSAAGHLAAVRSFLRENADPGSIRVFDRITASLERSPVSSPGSRDRKRRAAAGNRFRPLSLSFAERGVCICDGCDCGAGSCCGESTCCSESSACCCRESPACCCTDSSCGMICDPCCDCCCLCGHDRGRRAGSKQEPAVPAEPEGEERKTWLDGP